jgi:hypothetical protein
MNKLPLDHKSDSPESHLGPLPDVNKPPLQRVALKLIHMQGDVRAVERTFGQRGMYLSWDADANS